MDQHDYFAPVRYMPEDRPPRRGLSRRALIGIAVAAGVFAILGLLWYAVNNLPLGANPMLPPAKVLVGQPLKWRTLFQRRRLDASQLVTASGLFIGDFDGDRDDEILLAGYHKSSELFEVDGKRRRVPVGGMDFMMGGAAWDYDGDSKCDLVVDNMMSELEELQRQNKPIDENTYNPELAVYSVKGKLLDRLSAFTILAHAMQVLDVDGDGTRELLVFKAGTNFGDGTSEFAALAPGGATVWSCRPPKRAIFGAAGDVDGDGLAEVLFSADHFSTVLVYGYKEEQHCLPTWRPGGVIDGCLDVKGDGRDEILMNLHSSAGRQVVLLDTVRGELTALQLPPGVNPSDLALTPFIAVADFEGSGRRQIALSRELSSKVVFFDGGGQCTYYEEFGHIVFTMGVARAGGKDYLVVSRDDRLLIYP